MVMQPENVLALKSTKAQLEVGLIYLKRRHSELERQLTHAESQGKYSGLHPDALQQLRRTVQDNAIQIERRKLEIDDLDQKILAAQTQTERSGTQFLSSEHDSVTAQIGELREQILASLRQLAEPLQRYDELVEKKNSLTREISNRTGRDQSYSNYIESALLRQAEYVNELRYTIENLRRQRVVA